MLCLEYYTLIISCLIVINALPVLAQPDSVKAEPEKLLFKLYRDYISPADGDRCPMSPSCSGYGEQAVKKHGLFMGWIMACDRLIRCGRDEVQLSDTIESNGRRLTLDPVEANDFWWYPYGSSK